MTIHAEAADTGAIRSLHAITSFESDAQPRPLLSDSTVLRISNALQSSLYVKDVIHTFTVEARRIVRRISLRYRNRGDGVAFQEGRLQLHRCTYELNLLGKSLGELTFMRSQPFSTDDQALIEVMLCALVYPLRNALMYERALKTALTDPLTGVHNRGSMEQHLEHQVLLSVRHNTPLSLLMIDIDYFKSINDTHGHMVGDAVLTEVAKAIVRCTRNSDVVFRYGGEEFVVILTNTRSAGAQLLGQRICGAVAGGGIEVTGTRIPVTVSVGVAEFAPGDGSVDLLERADKQLYRAKVRGRNQVVTPDD
ncbi:MAG: GGDEF domain-containing protein [Gammaproteobacteria bacterium]|nr:GGDEF domain-containing protein [Gammaproteobacteria bacterium]